MKNERLSIRRSILEKSLEYLACPLDKSELRLNVPIQTELKMASLDVGNVKVHMR